ncbi:hypothetical protein [Streptomyces sp. NBC_00385]|uniref:hypothetical protein n=1 Tax=Streptomyces sp. NBC_00385 TaxID=2975733 RepID=UPI002DD91B64|nr:hypothetical protein [Streptomyces sp. NBC_00385]WRZ08491.1 hypothetical protein OG959_36665 [Streptomyces sp. NBC_00385]
MATLPREVEAFVAAASRLTAESLDEVRRSVAAATAAGADDALRPPALSAARFSALKRHVRDAFGDRAMELRSGRPGGLRSAIALTTIAAQAIWKREQLGPERFRALTGPFEAVGIAVPDGKSGT